MSEAAATRTPWHLWAVGILSLLWNSYGCYDYTMTQTGGEAYLRQVGMTDGQIAYFAAMPVWMTAVWAIGVWGALAGSVLLLLRSRWAVTVFVASLAAFVLSLVYAYGLSNGGDVYGQTGLIMNGVILAACLFFLWYAWRANKQGLLR
ncbi:MAG: hypothetical protein R3C25_02865 [Hyphomonadaceae bacterium]